MLRPRPALAALATVLAVAVGSTAAVLTTHRPITPRSAAPPGGHDMTVRIANTQLWVHDQDDALKF